MTYKEKFKASQDRAHYQNIATKILSHMNDLRAKASGSTTVQRRWIWELIQNAKDVHQNGTVRIRVTFNGEDNLLFEHDGKPFTAENIRFLIEQISTKDRKKDEDGKRKTTGKFGTGFLTTHLLSEKVEVHAVAKEEDLEYRKFKLELDRTGYDIDEITQSVEKSTESVQNLDDLPIYTDYDGNNFNTAFRYHLDDQLAKKIAQAGIKDLDKCLPYTLAFVEEIKNLEVCPGGIKYQVTGIETISENLRIVSISKNKADNVSEICLVILTKGLTTIAIPTQIDEHLNKRIIAIDDQVPRLFCDFPLIGSEAFSFPVIINNPHFNPTDPRDGVYLTESPKVNPQIEENKKIIEDAIELYLQLLEFAAENNWEGLHLLAQIKEPREIPEWISDSWFRDKVLTPVRTKLLHAKIVNTSDGLGPVSILNNENKKYIWFPESSKKESRLELWKLANYWFPHQLPREEDVEIWFKLSWKDCGKLTADQLASFVEQSKTLEELKSNVKELDVYKWLHDFYQLIKDEEKDFDSIINNRTIFPNQNGDLCKLSHLWQDAGDIDPVFKDVLLLLGTDIRNELADSNLIIELAEEKERNQSYVVKEISSQVVEKTGDREVASHFREAFSKLLLWFQRNPEEAQKLFSDLYRRKHLLYDEEVIADNMDKAEQLSDLLSEYGANDLDQLRQLLNQSQNSGNELLPVTQQIVASMGITSLEDWEEALKDKDLAALFSHESVPSTDMFLYVQTLITESKQKVLAHLGSLDDYDISGWDEVAPTTIAGVKKNGQDIYIVVRPAYNKEVIIYYGSEQNTLDFEESELWIYDGEQVKRITFGHILKSAKIRKFPI